MVVTSKIRLSALLIVICGSQAVAGPTAQEYDRSGNEKQSTGNTEAAIADYDKAIATDPKFAMAYNDRGTAKDDKGDSDGAIADYDKAIALDPKLAIAYENRAQSRKAKGDIKGADEDLKEAKALEASGKN